jgi:hypothetical protein
MPFHVCHVDGQNGVQWGSRKCYAGENMYNHPKASAQMRAIMYRQHLAAGSSRFDPVTVCIGDTGWVLFHYVTLDKAELLWFGDSTPEKLSDQTKKKIKFDVAKILGVDLAISS